MKLFSSVLLLLFLSTFVNAQMVADDLKGVEFLNWYNSDWELDNSLGASVDRVYSDFLRDKEPQRIIIVAVLDNGIDVNHEDLKEVIWLNEDEIPNNGIDDDGNGYVDDLYGWNFLGNSNGESVGYENFEYARIYKDYLKLKAEKKIGTIKAGSREDQMIRKSVELYEEEWEQRQTNLTNIEDALEALHESEKIIKDEFGIEVHSIDDVYEIPAEGSRSAMAARNTLYNLYRLEYTEEFLLEMKDINLEYTEYHLNLDLNARDIVGDDPKDITDTDYGNNDVQGKSGHHGTSCAGIIAAVRANGVGIDGVASNVEIMGLRTTPNGDEHDKDVALAIRYAVDNGAHIINMSFGKDLSPQKEFVDDAIRYAEEHGVLIVNSSGNSGRDLREEPTYPNKTYLDGTIASNVITVGASERILDKNVPAVFSNYGKGIVDILAPGVDIVSTDTSNTYSEHSGTSFSGPVVSGVAALIWSYYPDLSAQELIALLIESSYKEKLKKVYVPGLGQEKRAKVKLEEVSSDGGIVNVYNAFMMMEDQASGK